MIRTQISLTEEQMQLLRKQAANEGVPIAAVVREAVDDYLRRHDAERAERIRRALAIIGMIKDGPSDVAEKHDEYFADSIHDW